MSEIRQIQVDGVNYDLVISEDEVSATAAAQSAAEALAYKNAAQTSANTAVQSAQDAEDAADRAEAIVGGQFVSYGEDQGLTDVYKEQARKNIGAGNTNPNLLRNWYWVGGGTAGKFPVNQRGKNYYEVNDYTIDRWKSVNLYENSNTVKVATQPDGLVLAGNINSQSTYVQFQQIIENPPYGKEVTLSLLVDTLAADDDGNYPQIWCGSSVYKNINTTGLSSTTFTWPNDQNENYIRIVLYDGATQASSIRIQAIKLEVGSFSTLLQDVAPDFGEELRKCQRYLWVEKFPANTIIGSGLTFNTNTIYDIVTPVAMRTGGTLTMTASTSLYVVYNATYALAGVVNGITAHGNHLRVSMNNNGGSDYGTLNHADLLVSYETVVTVANEL